MNVRMNDLLADLHVPASAHLGFLAKPRRYGAAGPDSAPPSVAQNAAANDQVTTHLNLGGLDSSLHGERLGGTNAEVAWHHAAYVHVRAHVRTPRVEVHIAGDAHHLFEPHAAGLDPAEEMVALIRELRQYATTRIPEFLVVQQNAAALITDHPESLEVVDAIAQEAVWFDGDATDDWDDPDGYDWENERDLTDYYLDYLARYVEAGVPVFVCEYALTRAYEAYANSNAASIVPYVTRRSLSRLTTTVPPEY